MLTLLIIALKLLFVLCATAVFTLCLYYLEEDL